MNSQVIKYIQEARQHGLTDPQIRQTLLDTGWEAAIVDESFKLLGTTNAVQTPPAQPAVLPAAELQALPAQTAAAPKAKRWLKILLAVFAGLVVLGGIAYGYYNYVLLNPTKVWSKFLQTPQSRIYQSTLQFTYADPESLSGTSSIFTINNLKFSLNGNVYANASDAKSPQSSATMQYTYSSGNTSLSTGFGYEFLNNVLYVNVGSNPLLSGVFSAANGGQPVDWIKIDLTELQNAASSTPASAESSKQAQDIKNIFNTNFVTQLQQIWQNANIIKVKSYDGRQTINGVTTLHFENTLDKQALKNTFGQSLTQVVTAFKNQGQTISDEQVSEINSTVSSIIDKINVSDMQTWIGASDFLLYKVHFVSNAPSLISAIKSAEGSNLSGLSQSSDTKRLVDMEQLSSALELYYNDNNGYPAANGSGQPIGVVPVYIGAIPIAPTPPGGTCTDYFNNYWYTPSGKKTVKDGKATFSSYTYSFCLGSKTGTYNAGIANLTPSGISADVPCAAAANECSNPAASSTEQSMQDQVTSAINKINFDATITIDASYHDYGKVQTLTAPANALDIFKLYQQENSTVYPTSTMPNQ